MPTYTVTANIRSEQQDQATPITWSTDGTIADVMISVGQLIQHDLNDDTSPYRLVTESITITVNHGEA